MPARSAPRPRHPRCWAEHLTAGTLGTAAPAGRREQPGRKRRNLPQQHLQIIYLDFGLASATRLSHYGPRYSTATAQHSPVLLPG